MRYCAVITLSIFSLFSGVSSVLNMIKAENYVIINIKIY